MAETVPDIYKAALIITIACVTIVLFLFVLKEETHPDERHRFRILVRQMWKIFFLLGMIAAFVGLVVAAFSEPLNHPD